MSSFEQKLERYAELAVKVGANVQPGQTLVVNAMIDAAPLVRLIVKKAYETGAKQVKVNYSDEIVNRIRYDLAPDEVFLEPPTYYAEEVTELAEQGAAFLTILSSNPDLLKGVDPERISNYQRTYGAAMSKYRQYQQADKMSWTGIAYASPIGPPRCFLTFLQASRWTKCGTRFSTRFARTWKILLGRGKSISIPFNANRMNSMPRNITSSGSLHLERI